MNLGLVLFGVKSKAGGFFVIILSHASFLVQDLPNPTKPGGAAVLEFLRHQHLQVLLRVSPFGLLNQT